MRRSWLPVVVLAAVVVGGACSGASGDDTADSGTSSPTGDFAQAASDEDGRGDGGAAGGGTGGDTGSVAAVPVGAPLTAGRSIISTARAAVSVEDVEVAARRAVQLATAAGGFLSGQQARLEDREIHIELRVPTERFQQVLGDVADLGEVIEADVTTQDVTDQVVDLEGRIASGRASIERLRGLLGGAGDVSQLAAVEGELARREAELESLLGRLRVLEDQIDLSTIDVQLSEEKPVPEEDDDDPGFVDALAAGWGAFLNVGRVALVAVGFALPFVALALLAAVTVVVARRRPVPGRKGAS